MSQPGPSWRNCHPASIPILISAAEDDRHCPRSGRWPAGIHERSTRKGSQLLLPWDRLVNRHYWDRRTASQTCDRAAADLWTQLPAGSHQWCNSLALQTVPESNLLFLLSGFPASRLGIVPPCLHAHSSGVTSEPSLSLSTFILSLANHGPITASAQAVTTADHFDSWWIVTSSLCDSLSVRWTCRFFHYNCVVTLLFWCFCCFQCYRQLLWDPM